MLPLGASHWCREFTTGRISIFACLSQRSLCFESQIFCGIHVGTDTSRQKAINVLLAYELIKALAFRRPLKGALQSANLLSAFVVAAALLVYQHELPINR